MIMKVGLLRYLIYPVNLLILLNMFGVAQANPGNVSCTTVNRGSVCNGSITNYPTKIITLPNGTTLKVTGYGASFRRNQNDRVVVSASVSVENTSSKDVLLLVSEYNNGYRLIANSGQGSDNCRLDGLKKGIPSTHVVDYQRISAKTEIVIALTDCSGIDPFKTSSVSINIPVLELLQSSDPLRDNKVVPYTINSGKIPIK